MNPIDQYIQDRDEKVKRDMDDRDLRIANERYFESIVTSEYVRNFTWMGMPILQLPSDLMVMQELIWKIKPDYIIETGVAFGGMLVFYASILEAIGEGKVVGIDIDPREANMKALEHHRLKHRISVVKGSSIERKVIEGVYNQVNRDVVMVSLDSNHTEEHVLQELVSYSPLVSIGSYIVVFDTSIEFYHKLDKNQDRLWGKGNNPYTAVQKFMDGNDEFVVDKEIEVRAGITAAPGGWLRRIK